MAVAPNLEALVREELREPVAELVRKLIPELVAEQLNGHALAATVATTAPERTEDEPRAAEGIPERGKTSTGLTTCLACGEVKPPEEYSPGHSRCKVCRRTEERDRARRKKAAQANGGDPPG